MPTTPGCTEALTNSCGSSQARAASHGYSCSFLGLQPPRYHSSPGNANTLSSQKEAQCLQEAFCDCLVSVLLAQTLTFVTSARNVQRSIERKSIIARRGTQQVKVIPTCLWDFSWGLRSLPSGKPSIATLCTWRSQHLHRSLIKGKAALS